MNLDQRIAAVVPVSYFSPIAFGWVFAINYGMSGVLWNNRVESPFPSLPLLKSQ